MIFFVAESTAPFQTFPVKALKYLVLFDWGVFRGVVAKRALGEVL